MGSEMSRVTSIVATAIILLIVSLAWGVNHYRDNALNYKEQRDKATSALTLANETISDMHVRQREVATLDAKYTGELADAKKQLEDLQRCVSTGKCGLRVNAKCPANGTASAPGVDDGRIARLTGAAERDYWRLRDGIVTITKQLTGLQEYVREQCIN